MSTWISESRGSEIVGKKVEYTHCFRNNLYLLGLKNQKISFSYYFLNLFHSVYCLVVHYFITDELLFEPYTVPLAYACFSNFIKFVNILVKILVALS